MDVKNLDTGAVFSRCQRYRYLLWRTWDSARPFVTIIGLNPSRADATHNDPTIRRCQQFAMDWGFGGVYVVNLFAYRSPYPEKLRQYYRPVGPENDQYIQQAIHDAERTVLAWGNDGHWRGRDRKVLSWIDQPWCVKQNKTGQPAHPLYQPASAKIKPFNKALLLNDKDRPI